MGIGGSTQNLPDPSKGNSNSGAKNQRRNTKSGREGGPLSSNSGKQNKNLDMGASSVKASKQFNENRSANQSSMSANDAQDPEWRTQTSKAVERLQQEVAERDRRITELNKQVGEGTNRYENASGTVGSVDHMVETLKEQLRTTRDRLNEKDDVIRSLQRQLKMSRSDRDMQLGVVTDTVEKVIREKDSEIRRLRALWNESGQSKMSNIDEEAISKEIVSRATKILTSQELVPDIKNTRFGISAENRTSKTAPIPQAVPKTNHEALQIRKALMSNVFLKGLDTRQVNQLIECMTRETVSQGRNVITEGEHGTSLFVLETGKVEVFHSKGTSYAHIVDLLPGTLFGELAILYNCKRTASVRAKTDVTLWSLDRKLFQAIVKKSGEEKRAGYVRLLKTVDKLKIFSENKLLRIADCVEETWFKRGEYIIRQGEVGDSFYVIQDGQVNVTQNKGPTKNGKQQEELLCYLKTGDYFGERALLTEDNRAANVVAASDFVNLLMLDRLAFNSLLGSLSEVEQSPSITTIPLSITSSGTEVDAPQVTGPVIEEDVVEVVEPKHDVGARFSITAQPSRLTEMTIKKTPLDQLQILKVLGQGGFGCVKLVRIPSLPHSSLALKSIRKAKIIKTGQQQHVVAERNILMAMKSSFIGRLYRTYRDELRLYLLMEAYLGGEVYGALKRNGPMNDSTARFCAGCVLEALCYLHERGIVYRDLKPENLMLTHKGYVKLVDFGFAKRVKVGGKTWTFCGTPEYFPPEILSNTGHDSAADYWSYGILIYELLTRTTPFFASDDMTVYENILEGIEGVKFSRRVQRSAEMLIRALCKLEPRDRLGYQKGGPNDIRKHRWFQSFNWQGLRSNMIPSPIKVTVSSLTDTKNFDHCEEDYGNPEEDRKIIAKSIQGWDAIF